MCWFLSFSDRKEKIDLGDPDDIPGELLKYGADVLAPRFAELVNNSFARGEPLDFGAGTLLSPQAEQAPRSLLQSQPNCPAKHHSQSDLDRCIEPHLPRGRQVLSPDQSGFQKNRNTANSVWTHRWLCAYAQRYYDSIHILGIDLSRAFDTIDRQKLLKVLETFLPDDEVRLIRLLLANTALCLRDRRTTLDPFESNTDTPQGDSLSPVLFVVYLEGALREVASGLEVPYRLLEQMVVYANDADFIFRDPRIIDVILDRAPSILARWSLQMNITKTEITEIRRQLSPKEQPV